MAQELKAGDVVQLNSGGPQMTIARLFEDVDNEQLAICVWFDRQGEKQEGEFKTISLTKKGN